MLPYWPVFCPFMTCLTFCGISEIMANFFFFKLLKSFRILLEMGKGKLILICQSGGKFEAGNDGSLSYNGGEAEALDITSETMFDDLKLKLAKMWDLEINSVSIKYFIPGNRRTPITLKNDKDLRRMYEFHGKSVTTDVFVTGTKGFVPEVSEAPETWTNNIKQAETVSATGGFNNVATAAIPLSTVTTALRGTKNGASVPTGLVDVPISLSNSPEKDASTTSKRPKKATKRAAECSSPTTQKPVEVPIVIDMQASPADTVKKRRRTASYRQSGTPTAVDNDLEPELDTGTWITDSTRASIVAVSSSPSVECLVASWKDGITGEGQEFRSVHELRDALQKYAVADRFEYKFMKNDPIRVNAQCTGEGCSWSILATWVASEEVFKVKRLVRKHSCGEEYRKNAHPKKNWLVNIIKERLQDNPYQKTKDIAKGITQDFGIELNYQQVWRVVDDTRGRLQGSYKDSYTHMSWFCEKLVEANPASLVKLLVDEERQFQRLFVSFHALISGFQNGCRPLLFLDAMSLKSKYHEILLTATALDGEENVLPVAFAIVDVENDETWRWFLEQLKNAVTTSRSLTFVTDKEKGLLKTVSEVFVNAHYGYSIYYLMEDFLKTLRGPFQGDGKIALPSCFLSAVYADRLDGFKSFTDQIKQASPTVYEWVMQIEPQYWTNALFKGERYSHITFDVAEIYSEWVKELAELPILQKIEGIVNKMAELMNNRRNMASQWTGKLTPSKERKLQEECLKARDLKVFISSDTLFEVHDLYVHVVDINKRECSCLGWKATELLPCRHAIAVFSTKGGYIYDYCSSYFTVNTYNITYFASINPVSSIFKPTGEDGEEEAADESERVLPPLATRSFVEENKMQERTKVGSKRSVCCTKCKMLGHNKATCKAVL